MAVPPKTDPRWRALVTGKRDLTFKLLATKIAFNRIRRLAEHGDEASIKEAIDLCHDYFIKNEKIAESDLKMALG